MITVHQLLSEAKEKHGILHFITSEELPTSKSVQNFEHTLKETGTKHFYISSQDSKISAEDRKKHYQNAFQNHKHMIHSAETIFHAADDMKKRGVTQLTVMTHPSRVDELKKKMNDVHGKNFSKVDVQPLPNDIEQIKKTPYKDFHASMDSSLKDKDVRAMHKTLFGESFDVGDFVQTSSGKKGEIIAVGPTYATIVSEGTEERCFFSDLELTEDKSPRNQIYKDSFIYKGYKTKNFNRFLAETFRDLSKEEDDSYAVLQCIKAFDFLLGTTDQQITEQFNVVRIETERLRRYSKKLGVQYITDNVLSAIDEELLKYSILEGIRYTTTDVRMIGKVLGMMAGLDVEVVADPANMINQAAIKLRPAHLTPQGWEMLGRVFNVATKAGIKWNKTTFSPSVQKMMELI